MIDMIYNDKLHSKENIFRRFVLEVYCFHFKFVIIKVEVENLNPIMTIQLTEFNSIQKRRKRRHTSFFKRPLKLIDFYQL